MAEVEPRLWPSPLLSGLPDPPPFQRAPLTLSFTLLSAQNPTGRTSSKSPSLVTVPDKTQAPGHGQLVFVKSLKLSTSLRVRGHAWAHGDFSKAWPLDLIRLSRRAAPQKVENPHSCPPAPPTVDPELQVRHMAAGLGWGSETAVVRRRGLLPVLPVSSPGAAVSFSSTLHGDGALGVL